ncbi:hypothetical protein Tco_0300760 [Tanacetum coccineum]
MSFRKRLDSDVMCYTKALDSIKRWNDHFFWVDSFACPASFPWHTDKNVSRDPFLKPTKFRGDDYAVLVAYPAPFWKFTEPFLCLIRMSRNYTLDEDTYPTFLHDDEMEMDLLAFIHVADPTKVKVGERERTKEEARLLDSTVGRVVPLLPIAPDRADSELEASMEKLFDESGGANQGDSVAGGGQEIEAEIVLGVRFVDEDNVVAEKPKRPRKKRQAATDVSGFSHPPKKLRSDHGTSSGAASSGKSPTVLKQLLASSILNVESGVEAVATLPFVTSSISATPEHESGVPTDSITGLNLRTIGASKRFVISSDSSHHSSTNVPGAEGDSLIRSAVVPPVMTEEERYDRTSRVLPIFPGKSFPWGLGRLIMRVFMRFLFCTGTFLTTLVDNLNASREFIDHLAPLVLFRQIRDMDYKELFTEFSVGTARQKNMALEDEKKSLSGKVAELQSMISVKDRELKDVDATVTSLKSQNDGLADQVCALELMCVCWRPHVLASVNERVEKLDADLAEMASLEAAISRSIEKGIQDGLAAGIDHGRTGRSLADIVAYNPPVQVDFNSALQELCEVDFRLLANLKSHKDASIEDVMNLLRLESPLADAPSMDSLQHDIEQLKVPIHRANITEKRSALLGVWTPLSKPLMSRNYTLDEDTYPTFLYDDEMEMDLLAFIHVADPTKVKVGERECTKEEARLLDSTVGRVVLPLPIAPDRVDSELEASMEKLFDESGGANQGDSVAGGGQEIEAEIVLGVRFVDEDNVVAEKPKRPRKKRQAATDVSGFSHPPKKLRSDHGTSSGAASSGKSPTVLKQLLASSILNVESGVEAVAALPFVTSSISATPEHESGVPTDSITGLNLRTIGASKRFVISSDSSHHSSTNVPGAEGDSLIRSASGFHHDDRGGFHPIMYASIHSDTTPESWTITGSFPSSQETSFPWGSGVDYESFMRFLFCHCERRRLESECEKQVGLLRSKDKEIENLKAQLLFKEAEAAEKNMALEDEKKSLSGKVAELQSMISVKDRELKDVDVIVTSLKSQNNGLADQVPCAGAHVRPVNERVEKLDADLAEMACHLEEKFYPHLLTTIFGRGEPFNHGLEACSSGIDPWQGTGEKLADIVAYKPSVTCGFQFCPTRALPLADAPSMGRLQHDIEQLKVPIHRSEDQVVLGGFFVICP